MAGKGGKGLLATKTTAAANKDKDKDKKRPVSRSSRAGIQNGIYNCSCHAARKNCPYFEVVGLIVIK
ncbi:hypothetical protein OIU76_006822 [Salix suchowensis]|nr:hypothetical protein OIU76_006822 [Salix suchowensis]